jgi:hypothetical protein
MRLSKADLFILFVGLCSVLMAAAVCHGWYRHRADRVLWEERRDLVERLGLTDLALFTDARYTRHLTMADLNTPFQDHPMSFEHFPSGSILPVPPHLRRRPGVEVSR